MGEKKLLLYDFFYTFALSLSHKDTVTIINPNK